MEPPSDANLIDLAEQLCNLGSDPPSDDTPFPDRLGKQIGFKETINAPQLTNISSYPHDIGKRSRHRANRRYRILLTEE